MNALLSLITFLSAVTGDGPDLTDVSDKINELIGTIWKIGMSVAAGIVAIMGLAVGAMYIASLGDEQKKKSAKSALKTLLIGTIIVFGIAAVASTVCTALAKWANVSFGAY